MTTTYDPMIDADLWRDAADAWFRDGTSYEGGFADGLLDLCAIADTENRARLREAFPVAVGAWVARRDRA